MPSLTPDEYNSMQRQAGLMPSYGSGFPGFQQPISTFTNMSPLMPGPGGVLMPLNPATSFNPFGNASYGAITGNLQSLYRPGVPPVPPIYSHNPNLFGGSQPNFFENPYQVLLQQQRVMNEQVTNVRNSLVGVGARIGTNALVGATLGKLTHNAALGFAGFVGSELLGIGRAGQDSFNRNVMAPVFNMGAHAAAIRDYTQSFVNGGSFAEVGGSGLNRPASLQLARGLSDIGNSRDFQRYTMGRFNTADLMKILQVGGAEGMMSGMQSPDQIKNRVRDLAKSVSMFMELSNDPDLKNAIKTMGSMQAQGLSVTETLGAVRSGRAYARMANTTFDQLASVYGSAGAQTYQSMGLSQGTGFRTGIMHGGLAQFTQNQGLTSPVLMNMVGGPQGLANLNTMYSAGQLQMPMLAPAMMNANGGLNINALQGLMSGRMNAFNMTGMGANNLTAMTGRMGVEGLGMALTLQPFLQDRIGGLLQQRSPFAQRNMEDTMLINNMREMGMRGTSGFLTQARIHGMDANQALIRAQELSSPEYFDQQRRQIEIRRQERGSEVRRDRANRAQTSILDDLTNNFSSIAFLRRGAGYVRDFFGDVAEDLNRGDVRHLGLSTSGESRRSFERYAGGRDFLRDFRETSAEASRMGVTDSRGFLDRYRADRAIMEARGGAGAASAIGALFPNGDRARIEEQMQIGGRVAQGLLNSDPLLRRQAVQNENRFFGDFQTRQNIAQDVAGMIGNGLGGYGGAPFGGQGRTAINIATRGLAGSLSFGMIDPGNIMQSGMFSPGMLQQAYVQRMMQQGRSREQATQMFNQNREQIVAGISNEVMFYGDANTRRELERAAQAGIGSGDMGGNILALSERHMQQGYAAILGSGVNINSATGGRQARALDTIMDRQGEGFGRTDQQRARSRQIMAAMAIARNRSTDMTGYTEAQRRQASGQLREITEAARHEGFSSEQISSMMSSVQGQEQATRDTSGIREISSTISGLRGSDLINRMSQFEHGRQRGVAERQVVSSISSLGNLQGETGRMFAGLDKEKGDFSSNLRSRAMAIFGDRDRMSAISQEDPRLAQLIRQMGQGGEVGQRAEGDLLTYMRRRGEQADTYRQEYANAGRLGRLVSRNFRFGESESSYVQRQMSSASAADAQANREMSDVDQTEASVRRAGIGGSNDQLGRVVHDLARVTSDLRAVIDSVQLEGVIQRQ